MKTWRLILALIFLVETLVDGYKAIKAVEHGKMREAGVRLVLFFLFCNCVVGSLVLGAD